MPPPQRFKELSKVLAVRSRRPKKNGLGQHNSTTTEHDGSIRAQITGAVSFPSPVVHSESSRESSLESTNVPFAGYSRGVSITREASDMAQLALPLIQDIASAIPLVGAPMQAAIGGLLAGLQAIDVRACINVRKFLDFKRCCRDIAKISRTSIA
ncbi:hypothetical protein BDR06DRAFT_199245 [Suillus hirtellus]|nr:hypothetical protein BDR06DRAFT_199245 [Suillus hirtellus]